MILAHIGNITRTHTSQCLQITQKDHRPGLEKATQFDRLPKADKRCDVMAEERLVTEMALPKVVTQQHLSKETNTQSPAEPKANFHPRIFVLSQNGSAHQDDSFPLRAEAIFDIWGGDDREMGGVVGRNA